MQALANSENILVANVTDSACDPADGALSLSWTDAATTEQVRVRVQSNDPDISSAPFDNTFTVEKGKQSLTVDGLQNGEYYDVTIVSVEASGKEASGINLVGYPSAYPVEIDPYCVVTHGQTMYSWLVNHGSSDRTGTLTVTLTENDTVKETKSYPVTLAGNDRLQIIRELETPYATGQTLTLALTDESGNALAESVHIDRSAYYTERPTADKSALQIQLKYVINESAYTPETVVAYKEAYRLAMVVNANKNATQEEVNEALANLKEAKKNLKRLSTAGVMMTFSKSEGTNSRLLYGSMFYIDWTAADGVAGALQPDNGIDLSGSAENGANPNMHLKATVIFSTTDQTVDPASIWKELRLRLRSSHVDNTECASEFVQIRPADVLTPDVFEVDIPLSSMGTRQLDWKDVKELIIQCDINDAYKLPDTDESPICRLTLSDIWIEDTSVQPTVDKAALTAAIAGVNAVLADGKAYTADTKAALQTALTAAQAMLNDTAATQAQVDEATAALNTALAALQYAKGDVNGDGKIDVTDALMALQAAAGKITLTATEAAAANADGDAQGAITAADALLILKAATGQIAHF